MDGNYRGRLGTMVLERADLVVWLDPPLRTILARLLQRTIRRIRSREELWGTNREKWRTAFLSRDSLFLWAIRGYRRRAAVAERVAPFNVVRLRSAREVEEWLAGYVKVRM